MTLLRAKLLVLLFGLLIASAGFVVGAWPTLAHEQDRVQLTFRVALYGGAPERDESLTVQWFIEGDFGDQEAAVLCGLDYPISEAPDCEATDMGGYQVYEKVTRWPKGETVNFRFYLDQTGRDDFGARDVFFADTRSISKDTVINAYYDTRTGEGGELLADVPDTGAGGVAGSGLPAANALTVLSLLAAGGYTLRRRVGR